VDHVLLLHAQALDYKQSCSIGKACIVSGCADGLAC